MRPVQSWGLLTSDSHRCVDLVSPQHARSLTQELNQSKKFAAYGAGRSYGDVCLNPWGTLWMTGALNHLIEFDEMTGRLHCEAGVLLRDLQRLTIGRGWMLPVTPGTQMVTVGGAIANDVHGKNHHKAGNFGNHVKALTILRSDGKKINCSRDENADWLAATIGGLGLTGIIISAELQLRRVTGPWLDTKSETFHGLEQFFTLSDAANANWEYAVSWIDCLSGETPRGIFMCANHSKTNDKPEPKHKQFNMPLTPPVSLVNGLSLRMFNLAYYAKNKMFSGRARMHYQPFFYPLDGIQNWNRIYGPKGFYQYQSVIPKSHQLSATQAMLSAIQSSGQGSFLAVLKTFGPDNSLGMLSFPMEGVTLALDFPNRGSKTRRLFKALDEIVLNAGGRLYPAKDAQMSAEMFEKGYERLNEFLPYRDPNISTSMSRRLFGT